MKVPLSVVGPALALGLLALWTKDALGSDLCPSLSSKTLSLDCSFQRQKINCSESMPVGATVEFDCLPAFTKDLEPGYRLARCEAGGVWNKPLFSCRPDCGRRLTRGGTPLIAGGELANENEFPWHVALYRNERSGPRKEKFYFICGGAIINENFVITAAHCVWRHFASSPTNVSSYKVIGGNHKRTWENDSPLVQRRDVEEIKVHPRYRGREGNFQNDIAILRLSTPFTITWNVNLVCVDWTNDRESQQLVPGNMGVIAGWGLSERSEGPSDDLRYLELPFVPFDVCVDAAAPGFKPVLSNDRFCAGFVDQGKSACVGDTGGIYFKNNATSRYDIRGVVNIGLERANSGGCNANFYTAFTSLSPYRSWIQDSIKANP